MMCMACQQYEVVFDLTVVLQLLKIVSQLDIVIFSSEALFGNNMFLFGFSILIKKLPNYLQACSAVCLHYY